MKINLKQAGKLFLIGLLAIFLLAPTAVANDQGVGFVFNGEELKVDIYVENGVSYISAVSLNELLDIEVDGEGYVALRNFFEAKGADVDWNAASKQVIVSWIEDGKIIGEEVEEKEITADELMIKTTELLQEHNTYKMDGSATMKMAFAGPGMEGIPEMLEMVTFMEAVYQQNPLAMYIKQTVEMPLDGLELSEEELALIDTGMSSEMVWVDNAIYQKTPMTDQWIVQDLSELGMMENLTNMLNITPQQSMEMMKEFGVTNEFGEDVVIEGQEYYTIKNHMDNDNFAKIIDEMLNEFDFMGLFAANIPELDLTEEEMAEAMAEMQKILDYVMANIELDVYTDTLINKETLLTEYMYIDLAIKLELDETVIPEGPISLEMEMEGEFKLYDFGVEIQLPDVSNAITQQEYFEQLIEMMEEMPLGELPEEF